MSFYSGSHKGVSRIVYKWISVCVVMLALCLLQITYVESARAEPILSVQTYHAPTTGFLSNSHLILTRNDAILIDAQFSAAEGKKVIKMIEASGKQLSQIVITHSHPDHYYGLESIGSYYKSAVITGSAPTIKEIEKSIGYWTTIEDKKKAFAKTNVLQKDQLTLDGEVFILLTLENGESPANTVIYLPSLKVLFIGDLASNGVHMWLAEGNSTRWLSHLEQVRKLGPIETIYPGHGFKGDSSLIVKAEKYIKDFQATVTSATDAKTAIATMTALYPHYKMPKILTGSIVSEMAKRRIIQQ